MTKYGGIESGGSKWECAIATGPEELCAVTTIPTTTPEETIGQVVDFFLRAGPLDAIGIGSFGPVDTRIDSMTWGYITTTPKPGWANTDVGQEIRRRLDVPVAFDTDVERGGSGRAPLGGGTWVADALVRHGRERHRRRRDRRRTCTARPVPPRVRASACPARSRCRPVRRRLSVSRRLPRGARVRPGARGALGNTPAQIEDGNAWMLEARYLALGLVAVISVLSPERIVVGGGVAKHPGLLASVRQEVTALMNGYLGFEASDDYVTPPTFGARAGVLGAIALAESASVRTAPSPGSVLSRDR